MLNETHLWSLAMSFFQGKVNLSFIGGEGFSCVKRFYSIIFNWRPFFLEHHL